MKKFFLFVSFGLVLFLPGCEKEPSSTISSQWIYHNMISLPSNYVTCLAIDYNDSKWIGTKNGLVKFDGKKWVCNFNIQYVESDNAIKCIAVDKNDPHGKIFIGTIAGLTVYDPVNDRSAGYGYHYKDSMKDTLFVSFYYVNCITIDNKGNAWVAADPGLGKVDTLQKIIEGIIDKGALPFDLLTSDKDNSIWTGYHDLAIAKYNPRLDHWNYPFLPHSFGNYYQKCLAHDNSGTIWVGVEGVTDAYPVILMKVGTDSAGQDFSYGYVPSGGSSIAISTLMTEGNGFWAGTPDRSQEVHIYKFDLFENNKIKITKYSNSNFSTLFRSTSLALDKFGNKWIGSENGLFVFNENGVR